MLAPTGYNPLRGSLIIKRTKTVVVGDQSIVLEERLCVRCMVVPFWVTPTSTQVVHSNQCAEGGGLTNRSWRVQADDKLAHKPPPTLVDEDDDED